MTEYGYTATAFRKKTYSEILASMTLNIQTLYGVSIDLSVDTILGQLLRSFALEHSLTWDSLEAGESNAFLDTAVGVFIDRCAKKFNIPRKNSTYATAIVTFSGVDGTTIPLGFQVASGSLIYETTAEGDISAGSVDLEVKCTTAGIAGNVESGTITTIVESLAGLTSVTNASSATGGTEIESDVAYRRRALSSLATAGTATYDALYASLLGTEGISAVTVRYNNTLVTDGNGIPGKSINAVVLPSSAPISTTAKNAVAQTLHENVALGINCYGSETGSATAVDGSSIGYDFDVATATDIYANITITKNSSFESDGETQIKDALIRYVGGTDSEGTYNTGLSMGETVIFLKMVAEVMNITGVDDVTLTISDDNSTFVSTNITIDTLKFATISATNITITEA